MFRLKAGTHHRLSRNEARLTLAALGIASGILAGIVVNVFRLVLETPFPALGIAAHADDFESLPYWVPFLLPVFGCLVLIILFRLFAPKNREIGVAHVIDNVQNLKGRMPLKNAILQFLGSTVALLSGQSCGREGPGIHLGAASSSALCHLLNLPNNVIRLMIACGSAAAIAALFNTPIAGVIFAMEVIMMEYTIAGFLPVIIAAVAGTVITQLFHGDARVFNIADVGMNSLAEIPYVILMGLVIGVLASIFIRLQQYAMSFSSINLGKRLLLAGLLTGLVAGFIPEVMGTGYDSLDKALAGQYTLPFLATLLVAKLLLTPIVLGLGIPGGFIGSTIMMGGICGAMLGTLGNMPFPEYQASPGFYVLLGMCAMMGAVLQAPLAALMAILELSNNSNLILPAMLIIVVSNLTVSEGFRMESIYQLMLRERGIKTPNNLARLLHRYAVSSIMNTDFLAVDTRQEDWPEKLETGDKQWVLLQFACDDGQTETRLLATESLTKLLADRELSASRDTMTSTLKARSSGMSRVSLHATLQQALDHMQENDTEHAFIRSPLSFGHERLLGFIGADDIMDFYRDR